jgi:hypothetical protein
MRYLPCLLLTLVLARAADPAAPAAAPAGTPLFNGKDFAGWEFVTVPAVDLTKVCHYTTDGIIACAGKPIGFLTTTATYSQGYTMHTEWRWLAGAAANSNGGVLLHISSGPKDRQWPLSFQIQTKIKFVGDVLPMAGALCAELPKPPQAVPTVTKQKPDSEKPVGQWNTADIVVRGDTITVTINGVVQNTVTKCVPSTGKIGFQFEGYPFEMRNNTLTPLKD